MQKSSYLFFSFAVIGTVGITAITILQYIQAHHENQPGGYLPLFIGAVLVGLLAAICSYFASSASGRSALLALLIGLISSLAFSGILICTLVLGFGS
jgi:hypothetical protein